MDWEKDLLFLPYTYTPSSSTVGLLLDLQYYQRRESMIFKIWVKSKFVLWQPRYYNWLTEKRIKQIMFLEYSFFWKRTTTDNSWNSLPTPSLDAILLEKYTFTMSNSIILVEDLVKWKRCFEIFLIDHCAGDIGNKNIAGNY